MSIYRVFVPFREAINSLENNIKSISNCFSIPKVFDDLQKSIIPTKTKARTIPLTTGKRPVEDHGDEESACSAVISFPSIKCPEGSYDSGEESMNDETDGNTSSIIKDNMKSERGNDLNAQSKPMKQKFQHQKSATEQYLSMILSHAEHKCIVGKDSIGVKNHSKYEISTIKQGH